MSKIIENITRGGGKTHFSHHNRNYIFLIVLNVLFFTILSWLLPIRYEQNDDVMMCMIANGVYGGSPDYHLVFINALLGFILKSLYLVTRCVEWYTLMLAFIQIVSISTIVHLVISKEHLEKWMKVLVLSIVYVFWIRLIATFQFTSTAGIAAFSGSILLLNGSKKDYLWAFSLILLAALVRFEMAGMMLLLFSPLFLRMIVAQKKEIFTFTILAVFIFSLPIIDNSFYKEEWKQFKEYNFYRGKINDNPNYWRANDKLPEGISKEDYHMFLWGIGDGKVFTLNNINSIYNTLHHPSPKIRIKHIKNIIVSKDYFLPIIIIILLSIIVFFNTKSSYRFILLSSIIATLGVFMLISMNAYLKDRVFICMILPIIYTIIISLINTESGYQTTFKVVIHCCFVCVIGFYAVNAIYRNTTNMLPKDLQDEQCELLKSTDEYVYNFDCSLAMDYVWNVKDFPARPVSLGWLTNIPLSKNVLLGYDDFVNNKIVIFSNHGNTNQVEKIQNYLLSKYNIDATYTIVNQSEHYALYKITKL